eukprot:14740461-Heterocapsa_arctica.AAC.1
MIKTTPKGGVPLDRKRKHEQGEAKVPPLRMLKPDGYKGGKGSGKEPQKQWGHPSGWQQPQGWQRPQGGGQPSWSSNDQWAPSQGYD